MALRRSWTMPVSLEPELGRQAEEPLGVLGELLQRKDEQRGGGLVRRDVPEGERAAVGEEDKGDVGLLRPVRDHTGLRDARRALADIQEQLRLPRRVHERVVDRVLAARCHVIEVDLVLVVRVPAEGGKVRVHDPVTDLLFGNVLHVAEDFSRDLTEV